MRTCRRQHKRLLLHFDVNKTIVLRDPAAGYASSQELASATLCESAWGRTTTTTTGTNSCDGGQQQQQQRRQGPLWRLVVEHPSLERPADVSPSDGSIMTYARYVDQVLRLNGLARREARARFVDAGEPGEALRPWRDRMMAALALPPPHDRPDSLARQRPLLRDGQHFLLPSFINLITHLVTQAVDFGLIFRTFGSDLLNVAQEFNDWCSNRHPLFPLPTITTSGGDPKEVEEEVAVLLDGSAPLHYPHDRRLWLPPATMARRGHGPQDTTMTYYYQHHSQPNTSAEAVSRGDGGVVVAQGFSAIHDLIVTESAHRTIAIQDDYSWWSGDYSSDTRGKLLLLPGDSPAAHAAAAAPARLERQSIEQGGREEQQQVVPPAILSTPSCPPPPHQVFLDDYIGNDRPEIVDARGGFLTTSSSLHEHEEDRQQDQQQPWEVLPFKGFTQGRHLLRVDTVRAVLEPTYFIEMFEDKIRPHLFTSVP